MKRYRIAKLEEYIEEQMNNYKRLWEEDIKAGREIDKAMDREAMKVLTKIKMILEEN